MLSPHELKNAEFSKSLRGYSTVEVDEHIEFIIEKYTELYRINDDLEKKLRLCQAQLDALKAEEESIKSTLVNAQKASTRIIAEANERADVIMRSAKSSCDRIIEELKENIKEENERLKAAQNQTMSFKAAVLKAYLEQVEKLEGICPEIKEELDSDSQAEALSNTVIERIREDLAGEKELISGSFDPFTPENPENEIIAEEGSPAEMPIPEDIETESEIKPDEEAFASARDSEEDFLSERTVIVESGSSLLESIKKISESAGEGIDDEDFISMLGENSSSDGNITTDEFDVVYEGKKKKKK